MILVFCEANSSAVSKFIRGVSLFDRPLHVFRKIEKQGTLRVYSTEKFEVFMDVKHPLFFSRLKNNLVVNILTFIINIIIL